jgi:hypothetical protein
VRPTQPAVPGQDTGSAAAVRDPAAPVQLAADRCGAGPLPDLDVLPPVASLLGVDLNPLDVLDCDARRWLEALVWPENHRQRALLSAALADAAADPPSVRAGDAIDLLPGIGRELPAGEPRVVFHSATRMHVPGERLDAFDAAIAQLNDGGPLWRLSIEESPDPDPRPSARLGAALLLRRPSGETDARRGGRPPALGRDAQRAST